jgi:acetyl-CoA C-acetyltransferase
MMGRVVIVGAVQTRYEPRKAHQAINELVYEVVAGLLKQTGVRMQEIDSMVTASQDAWDGKTISSMSVNEVVGAYLKSEAKVAADGIQALIYGAARILAGAFDYTLIVAHCKESEGQPDEITKVMFDPFCERPLGLNDAVAAGLQARRYISVAGIDSRALALVSQKNHRSAKRNPLAQRSGDYSLDEILAAPSFADPLTELMAGPRSDGACALLLASAEKAAAFGDRAVCIAGMGNSTDSYWTDRDLSEAEALRQAAQRAYTKAGISPDQVDVAEISARYAHEELLYGEALGLWKREELSALLAEKNPLRKRTKVNPSGGPITGNPTTVAGLARVAEGYLQLAQLAGDRQVPGAQVAVAHGASGVCGQSQSVVILRRGNA